MKKVILSLAVVMAGLVAANAQGTVKLFNTSASFAVSTNGTGTLPGENGTTTGKLAASTGTAGLYYFALLTDTTTPTSSNPTSAGWTLAKSGGASIVGTNYSIAGDIIGTGSTGGVAVDGWAPGTSAYVELVGWSASLGTSYATVLSEFSSTQWAAAGYFGYSSFGSIASGGVGTPASAAASLFATGGIPAGFDLNGVSPIPEPSTIALAGLGGLSLLAMRRKKA